MAPLAHIAANDHQEDSKNLLEKILDKVDSIEQAVKAKADATAVLQLEKRLQSLEEKEIERDSLNRKVDEVVALLSDQRDELKEHITNDIVMDRIQNKLTEDEMEKEEQKKRRKSVIVFGLKESCSTDAEVRIAEDAEKVQEVLQELELHQEADISKVIRLGRRAETADGKPRPLKVAFESEDTKSDVLKKAKNLKNKKEGGLDKVFIYQDLTPKQREARKKLVAELKSRQSNGETGLIIVGSKIVKRRAV